MTKFTIICITAVNMIVKTKNYFMRKLCFILLLLPCAIFSQTHYIDNTNLQATGLPTDFDITKSTFYNAYDTCTVSWVVISDSMPAQWDISFCFPACYPIGVTSAQDTFMPTAKVYLNGHFYPNLVSGEGYMQMQITTNSNIVDTITWYGVASEISNLESIFLKNDLEFTHIYDTSGRRVENFVKGKTFIVKTRQNTFKSIYVL